MAEPTSNILQRRIVQSLIYSLQGLRSTFKQEEAFRVELFLAAILIPSGLFLGNSGAEKALLSGSVLLVLIVEILNSAIESVVDRFGPQQHELAGQAKDQGSAAVFLTLLLTALIWGCVLIS